MSSAKPSTDPHDGLPYAIQHVVAAKGAERWVVRFSRHGRFHDKTFPFLKHGGRDAALAAAIAWRDERLALTAPMTVLEFAQRQRSNNTSGVPGVTFGRSARQPEGFWQARLTLADGTRWRKTYSVKRFGDVGAFDLAVQARQNMLKAADDRVYVHDPVAAAATRGPRSVG
jgi:hypothetical protein